MFCQLPGYFAFFFKLVIFLYLFNSVLLLSACMSAMAVGTTMSWTSAAEGELTNEKNNFHIDKTEFSWVGAFLSVGAVVGAIPLGFLANVIGRKKVLIGLAPFMTLGFVLLACANAVSTLWWSMVLHFF